MITQKDVIRLGLPDLAGRQTDECSVGLPSGKGIRLGYAGWGEIDVALDPRLPLDMSVSQMGLEGRFKKVSSCRFLNVIHGDCNLSHAVYGLLSLLSPNGELVVTFLSTADMAADAVSFMLKGNFEACHSIEKICFSPPLDHSGMAFHQTFLNEKRVTLILHRKSFVVVKEKKAKSGSMFMFPDDVRLDGISDQRWVDSSKRIEDSLEVDRPRCALCSRPATKMDNNRKYFSRYCKDHYYDARRACDESMLDFYTVKISVRRTS